MNSAELLDLKNKIEKMKNEKATLEGKLSGLIESMQRDFNVSSIDNLDLLIKEKEKEVSEKEKDLEVIKKELERIL